MNDVIALNYDPFSMHSRVMIHRNGETIESKVSSSLSNLPNNLYALSSQYDIKRIKISAPSHIVDELRQSVYNYSKEIVIEAI